MPKAKEIGKSKGLEPIAIGHEGHEGRSKCEENTMDHHSYHLPCRGQGE
jgi:hypothetical protein